MASGAVHYLENYGTYGKDKQTYLAHLTREVPFFPSQALYQISIDAPRTTFPLLDKNN